MAKRTPTRTRADDNAARTPEAARKPRAAARTRTNRDAGGAVGSGQEEAGAMSDEFLGEGRSAGEPAQADAAATRSTSMGSEPSEEDIRLRAYQRFLERGGTHGQDQDDWIKAERELRGRK
jgi:Protein of unknown function (DUF2934)